ncbi:hypothetical protein RCL1_009096 [Eukaryota sp. TZLM3-RCL]
MSFLSHEVTDNLLTFEQQNSPFLDVLTSPSFKDEFDYLLSLGSSAIIILPLHAVLQDEVVFSHTFIQSHLGISSITHSQSNDSGDLVKFVSFLGARGIVGEDTVSILEPAIFESSPFPSLSSFSKFPSSSRVLPCCTVHLIRKGYWYVNQNRIRLVLVAKPLPEPDFIPPIPSDYLKKKRRINFSDLVMLSPYKSEENIHERQSYVESSEVTLGSYCTFLDRLRSLEMTSFYREVNVFLFDFMNQSRSPQWLCEWVPEVVVRMLSKLAPRQPSPQLDAVVNYYSADFLYDCIEKLVFNKLYDLLFPCLAPVVQNFKEISPSGPVSDSKFQAIKRDEIFDEKIQKLREISFSFSHLDLNVDLSRHPLWSDCIDWLTNLDQVKSPRDKLVCLSNCCKCLLTVLSATSIGNSFGADMFLPSLIVLIVKESKFGLNSQLDFIKCWRPPLKGESSYYLTSCLIATEFIAGINIEEFKNQNRSKLSRDRSPSVVKLEKISSEVKWVQPSSLIDNHPLSIGESDIDLESDEDQNDCEIVDNEPFSLDDCKTIDEVVKFYHDNFSINIDEVITTLANHPEVEFCLKILNKILKLCTST